MFLLKRISPRYWNWTGQHANRQLFVLPSHSKSLHVLVFAIQFHWWRRKPFLRNGRVVFSGFEAANRVQFARATFATLLNADRACSSWARTGGMEGWPYGVEGLVRASLTIKPTYRCRLQCACRRLHGSRS